MKYIMPIYAVMLTALLASCNHDKQPLLAPEYLFDAEDQKVISSLINKKDHTIAIIYGNGLALRSAQDTVRTHTAGERYTMVTWKQRAMPHWYGTNMNGKILSVETVIVRRDQTNKLAYEYRLNNIRTGKSRDRIHLITCQPSAVLPGD